MRTSHASRTAFGLPRRNLRGPAPQADSQQRAEVQLKGDKCDTFLNMVWTIVLGPLQH